MHRVTHRPTLRLAALLIAIAGATFACGDRDSAAPAPAPAPEATEAAPEAAEPPAAERPADGRPLSADDLIITEEVVPETFPSDVPIYPNAKPGSAMEVPGLGMFITFVTDDEPDAVYEHFRSGLGENGWSVSEAADAGVDGSKGERTIQVRARPNESGRTEIAINIDEGAV